LVVYAKEPVGLLQVFPEEMTAGGGWQPRLWLVFPTPVLTRSTRGRKSGAGGRSNRGGWGYRGDLAAGLGGQEVADLRQDEQGEIVPMVALLHETHDSLITQYCLLVGW